MKAFHLLAGIGALLCAQWARGQEPVQDVQWAPEHFAFSDLSAPTLIEVPALESSGFHFEYFLYLPKGLPAKGLRPAESVRILVEPNNTGQTSDDPEVHRASAKRLAASGSVRKLADRLQSPLLVPVFPRPRSQPNLYTHYLDRDAMRLTDGPMARIDLQLLAMIAHARKILDAAGIATEPRIFMHGFSASAGFSNRFATLHPEAVRAIAVGGVNALPMYPLREYEGVKLNYPLGIADIKALTGAEFNAKAYGEVAQFLTMGYLDRNDTLPFPDAWDDDERELIGKFFGQEMMPDRWERAQQIIASLQIPIQTATYNGVPHAIRAEMWDGVFQFFKANDNGTGLTKITPHQYPFVAFKPLQVAHVSRLLWKGDAAIPARYAKFPDNGAFLIEIQDWMTGQDYQQLRSFLGHAGFEFDLVAEGHETVSHESVHIDRSCANASSGDGSFQAFYVCLKPEVAEKIAAGASYSLRPKKTNQDYFWEVRPSVALTRPDEKGVRQ